MTTAQKLERSVLYYNHKSMGVSGFSMKWHPDIAYSEIINGSEAQGFGGCKNADNDLEETYKADNRRRNVSIKCCLGNTKTIQK
jgi:hypothetical protein